VASAAETQLLERLLADPAFRERFQDWLRERWREKDEEIDGFCALTARTRAG